MDATPIVAWLFGTVIFFALLFLVVRAAVRAGLQDHQEWLEGRSAAKDSPQIE
jgi:hypothetical protein